MNERSVASSHRPLIRSDSLDYAMTPLFAASNAESGRKCKEGQAQNGDQRQGQH
jgi:hypothetical protein